MNTPLEDEIATRFGVLPNFFSLASSDPKIAANLWKFTQFAYLDNPLPSLFKERLFVYLSRFCPFRYCLARHVGFLVGLGYPAGDSACLPQTVESILPLLRRPLPHGDELLPFLSVCAAFESPISSFPESDNPGEQALFACATHVFLQTPDRSNSTEALRRALGPTNLEQLNLLLAFVRTAHYWTELHPELAFEDDITQLLAAHEALAHCIHNPEAPRDGHIDPLEGKLADGFVTDNAHKQMLEQISETSRKQLSALAASLLRAQEKERRRISRDLHDTLCQQLASLAFDVGDLAAQTSSSELARRHLRNIQARIVRMSEEIRHIAYQLHPSELDDLGLNATLQALCDEVSKRHRITIKVACNDVSEQLPLEVASCLYRVCQEGLNNMVKHSKAKRASVTLIEEQGSVALSIKDDGVGFRLEAVEAKGGLGIIGMKERAQIVNGKLSIQSRPGKGTMIDLIVPLPARV